MPWSVLGHRDSLSRALHGRSRMLLGPVHRMLCISLLRHGLVLFSRLAKTPHSVRLI